MLLLDRKTEKDPLEQVLFLDCSSSHSERPAEVSLRRLQCQPDKGYIVLLLCYLWKKGV
jgi:hypothetical protein